MPLACLLLAVRLPPRGIRLNEKDYPVGQERLPAVGIAAGDGSSVLLPDWRKSFGMDCAKKD